MDPHDKILETLRQYEVEELSRSEFIGQLVGLCEDRYRDALEAAARVCEGQIAEAKRIHYSLVGDFEDLPARIRALAPGATDTSSQTSDC